MDIVWHPVRPIICSVSSGVISIWSKNQVENWSAFAPDFTELDENVEYSEKESEFDEEDEDKSLPPPDGERESDVELEVDVEAVDRIEAFCSSDEEIEGFFSNFCGYSNLFRFRFSIFTNHSRNR